MGTLPGKRSATPTCSSLVRRNRMYPRYSATIRFSIISTTHPPRIRARASGQRGQHRPPGHPEDVCSGQFVRIHDALPDASNLNSDSGSR